MVITSTDFQKDIGKHFEIVDKGEEIIITVRGTQKYKLTKVNKVGIVEKLAGKYSNIEYNLRKIKKVTKGLNKNMVVLIDTNLVIDFLCKREPFFEDAFEIIKHAANDKCKPS